MNLDPDRDGELTVSDLSKLLNDVCEDEYDERDDFNGDGVLTVADVSILLDALAKQNGVTITLDPGHGKGYNTVKYKDFTYSEGTRMYTYALMLQRELIARGYKVFLTRQSVEDDPTHKERAQIAAKHNSDVFLSLHSNAKDDDPDKKGMVVIYSMADKAFNKPFGWAVAEADAAVMGNGVVDVYWSESKAYPGEDYFGILRNAVREGIKRALIIEHGYHSNEGEARFLSDDANLQTLAKAEAKAIDDYLRENLIVDKKITYRVQVGSYATKANAEKKVAALKNDGFGGFMEKQGLVYKVYSGSYTYLKYAEAEKKKLEEKGYNAIIVKTEI